MNSTKHSKRRLIVEDEPSGHAGDEMRESSLNSGAVAFLNKPFRLPELVDAFRSAFSKCEL